MLPAGDTEEEGQPAQVDPNPGLYVPFPHNVHALPLTPAYPALHSQAVFVMLPAGEVDCTASHAMHSSGPRLGLYLPATHSVQSPFGPVHPALQTHAVTAVLPCNEAWFNGQSTQAKVPGVDLYLPGAHITQGPPSEPADPELQIHCVMTVLFSGEVDCNGQAIQAADIP